MPFSSNYTKIGYLPDGLVVKYLYFPTNVEDRIYYGVCDKLVYAILPDFIESDITRINRYHVEIHGGITIGVDSCFPEKIFKLYHPSKSYEEREYDSRFESYEETRDQ